MNKFCVKLKISWLRRKRRKLGRFLSNYGFEVFMGEREPVKHGPSTGEKLETRRDANIRNIRCSKLPMGECFFEYHSNLNAAAGYPEKFRKLVAYHRLLQKLYKELG